MPRHPLRLPNARLRALAHFADEILEYRLCGYFGIVGPAAAPERCTLYVERRDSIPTDFDAR